MSVINCLGITIDESYGREIQFTLFYVIDSVLVSHVLYQICKPYQIKDKCVPTPKYELTKLGMSILCL